MDFITPLVDDARTWGAIAATNAVSDVYAMGGRPIFALNVVAWNHDELPDELLVEVLEGAAEVARAGGWVTVGGHTVDDPEPKFGLAVIGEVHPDRLLRVDGLRDGDVLVLTKPLGVGIAATALKAGAIGDQDATMSAAVGSMLRTNERAAAAALRSGATGATDVTGFGLLGHLRNLLEASGMDGEIDVEAVPLLPGVRDLARAGHVPGGTRRNLDWVSEVLDPGAANELDVLLLADAQTSGGLLFGARPDAAQRAVETLTADDHTCAVVGRVSAGSGSIRLR